MRALQYHGDSLREAVRAAVTRLGSGGRFERHAGMPENVR
jgi:hypothetical protein